jgi:3-oxoacyl-[acyl-carrier-protein] synthase-3
MILSILKRNQLSQADVDLLIPHQASGKGVKAYWKFGGFDKTKVMDIVNETGNCVAASLPLALVMAFEQKKINNDDIVLLVGTGAGLSIASAIIKL